MPVRITNGPHRKACSTMDNEAHTRNEGNQTQTSTGSIRKDVFTHTRPSLGKPHRVAGVFCALTVLWPSDKRGLYCIDRLAEEAVNGLAKEVFASGVIDRLAGGVSDDGH